MGRQNKSVEKELSEKQGHEKSQEIEKNQQLDDKIDMEDEERRKSTVHAATRLKQPSPVQPIQSDPRNDENITPTSTTSTSTSTKSNVSDRKQKRKSKPPRTSLPKKHQKVAEKQVRFRVSDEKPASTVLHKNHLFIYFMVEVVVRCVYF